MEGCLDTTELAALLARPRQSPALSGGADGGVGAGGKRRKGRQGGQKGWGRAGKGVGVSSLFAVGGGDAGGAVDVKANVFVTGQGLKLEFCVVGTGFYTVRKLLLVKRAFKKVETNLVGGNNSSLLLFLLLHINDDVLDLV